MCYVYERENESLKKFAYGQMADMYTAEFKVDFITRYQQRGAQFLSPYRLQFRHVFIKIYSAWKWSKLRKSMDIDDLFDMAITDFKKYCDKCDEEDGCSRLEGWDDDIDEPDKIFLCLVRVFNTLAQYDQKLAEWTSKEIAHTVLCYMDEYFEQYWKAGSIITEDFLDYLLSYVHNGQGAA